jgi:hypothetical protein
LLEISDYANQELTLGIGRATSKVQNLTDFVHSSRQSLSNIATRRAHSVFVCESFAESDFSSSDS